jgi:cobalamin biosynthesis protein CbiG
MSLVVGVGLSSGAEAEQLSEVTGALLRQHGLDPRDVTAVVTLDRKAQAPAVRGLAAAMNAEVTGFPCGLLATQDAPHRSAAVRSAVETASVAEAAVLAAGATLVVPKTVFGRCTVAVGLSRSPASRPPGIPEGLR